MKFGDAIFEISSISNVSSQQADGITLSVRCNSEEFEIQMISLDKPSLEQRRSYELLYELCTQENLVMKQQLPAIVGARFNPNYAALYAEFGVPTTQSDDEVKPAEKSDLKVLTGVGCIYWIYNTREFIISYCSELMHDVVECGKVIKGLEAIAKLGTNDGKCEAIITNASFNEDNM